MEADSEETESVSKSHLKRDAKIIAQSSQIQNLCNKLDAAVAENSQMHEYLHPSTLQTTVTNALQAVPKQFACGYGGSHGFAPREGKPFLGQPREPQLLAWVRMGPQILTRLAGTARILGTSWRTVYVFKGRRISKLIIRQDRG